MARAQQAFDRFRHSYNSQRPHEAIGMAVPADRYRQSPRPFRSEPVPFDYGPDDRLRRVCAKGAISFKGRDWRVSKALVGKTVAVRPTPEDGVLAILFRSRRVKSIDLRYHNP